MNHLDGTLRTKRLRLLDKLVDLCDDRVETSNVRLHNIISKLHDIFILQAGIDYTDNELDREL